MDDYIPKPVRPEMLQAIIERLGPELITASANSSEAAPAVVEPAPVAQVASVTIVNTVVVTPAPLAEPPVDLQRLDEFAGGSEENFYELVTLYLNQTAEQISQIESAVQTGDLAKIARVAHSCAGASSTCGMVVIAPLLKKIELTANGSDPAPQGIPSLLQDVQREFVRIKDFLNTRTARS
jgi:HPt (histidine-containing phosphotransfer) domain-containing protein